MPETEHYDAGIDALVLQSVSNILYSQPFEYGLSLITGTDSWMLDRMMAYLTDSEPLQRQEVLAMIIIILKTHHSTTKA